MRLRSPAVFLLLVFPFRGVLVHWNEMGRHTVTIRAEELEQDVKTCLDSARQAKVRFDMRLCHRNPAWFDSCTMTRSEIHAIEFDPISESFRVISDRYGDDNEPTAVGIPAVAEAIRSATALEEVPLEYLAGEEKRLVNDSAAYLQVRTSFSCRGAVNRTVARLSQVLTLGLVNVVESTTPWGDFDINPRATS